jgi:hypothetical protein
MGTNGMGNDADARPFQSVCQHSNDTLESTLESVLEFEWYIVTPWQS